MANFTISKNKEKLDLNLIYSFLKKSYWANKRTKKQVEKSIKHSICYGIYEEDKQIGFARAISDYVTFAYIADVFIIEEKRGIGMSIYLMNYILSDELLTEVDKWYLITKNAQGLYQKFGFKVYQDPVKTLMLLPKSQKH